MRKNLLTFIGLTDIKTHENKEYNGAVEQILSKYDFENISPRFGVGSKKWQEMKNNPLLTDETIPFSVADMELKTAPEITEGLKNFIDNNVLGYAGSNKKYRHSVYKWMKNRHNWEIQEDWLIETHSVVNAFFTALHIIWNIWKNIYICDAESFRSPALRWRNQKGTG